MVTARAKNKIESVITPIAARLPISPNLLTLLAVLIMAIGAWAVLQNNLAIAAALIIASGFIDVLDGTVAKAQRRATAFGAFLDRVGDRVSDAMIFGSIILAGFVQLWLGLAVLVLVLLGSYASACLEAFSKTRIGEAFSMRVVRLLLLAAGLLIANFVTMDYVLAIIGILTIAALMQRLWAARKILK